MDIKRGYARRYILNFALFCLFCALLFLILMLLSGNFAHFGANGGASESTLADRGITVIIDAGHGGEDGGASYNGLVEKNVNLDIAKRLARLLEGEGVSTVLTRERDELLYDKSADHKGKKKILDMRARLEIAEKYENAVFVSIHQNYFSQAKYRGLQVWYSQNDARSKILAETVQGKVRKTLQPDNERQTKQGTSAIFLLHNLKCPAVLIECGFLSNKEEAALLANEEYRESLAKVISSAIIEYILRDST